jgi:hypothetical protein
MEDIILEVRRIREAYAAQFGFDLRLIHEDLKKKQQASGRWVVSLPPRPPRPVAVNGSVSRKASAPEPAKG